MHDPSEYLALANRHVVESDERIAAQRERVERQRQAGHDVRHSQELLRVLLEGHKLLVAHQKELEREMAEWRTLHPEH